MIAQTSLTCLLNKTIRKSLPGSSLQPLDFCFDFRKYEAAPDLLIQYLMRYLKLTAKCPSSRKEVLAVYKIMEIGLLEYASTRVWNGND